MINAEESISVLLGQVNVILVVCLMALGYIIKHVSFLSKLDNGLIPIIIPVVSVIVSLALGDLSSREMIGNDVISGIINGAIAVWAHQTGRNVFDIMSKNADDANTNENITEEDK